MQPRSIKTKLTLSIGAFLVLLVVVSLSAIVGIGGVTRNATVISEKWLSATQMLGELSDRLTELRLSENYRALPGNAENAAVAETDIAAHQTRIEELLRNYVDLVGDDMPRHEVEAVMAAWASYKAQHAVWDTGDATLQQNRGRRDSSQHRAYEQAHEAVGRLIEASLASANSRAAAAERIGRNTIQSVTLLAIVGALLTLLLIREVRVHIADPLAAITAAASRLAAGSRDLRIPEVSRTDEIGEMAKAFEVFRANASALEDAQRLANSLARHDALTGLPNRRLFAADLDAALAEVRDSGNGFTVMLIDLDRFKPVNDLQGHAAGDLVLCEVAGRLQDLVGKGGTVARLGGDEFAIITQARSPGPLVESAIRLAGRIVASVREPMTPVGSRIEIGASVGIALCPSDGDDAETLIRAADLAMYRAKQDGRGTFRFFEQSMDQDLRDKAALEADFRAALKSGQIKPFYQPLVDIGSTRICGFEVLARWHHAEQGFIAPDTFIPMAEQLGLIGDLTAGILRQACRDSRDWDGIKLALNISPAQFQDAALPTLLLSIMVAEGFPPERLEVEVTESALVGDLEAAKATLHALQQIGVQVALDDFGTGYSSLYHLREMKFDKIKIDRSFVQSMGENPESEKIVDAVLGLAKSLGMPTVAEGIESADIRQRLADRGCTYGQGYLFSRAVPADSAEALMVERRSEPDLRARA
ncbi:MAG: putative bifunctional diguanylate cyclase/phosphodiesterase [Janthinobacterium lividum]